MSLGSYRNFVSREKWWTIKDRNWILTPEQEKIWYFERNILSIRTTYRLKNMSDQTELIVQQKLIAMRPTFKFYRPDKSDTDEPSEDNYVGQIKKALISIGDKYWYELPSEEHLFELKGNIFGLKFKLYKGGAQVGEVGKKFWKIKDTYGIQLNPDLSDEESLIALGMVIILNFMNEHGRNRGLLV